MHKYIASKSQRVFHIGCILYPLSGFVFVPLGIYHVARDKQDDLFFYICMTLLFAMAVIGFFGYAWKFFDDPILGKFSFDKTGVTFYTPLRIITFPYDECAEIGFTRWIAGGAIANRRYLYYIFFSKKTLTEEQRAYLFEGRSKNKRGKHNKPLYQSEYVLFQYRPDVFADFIECVPERFRNKLIQEKENLDLKPYEKFLNR